MDGCLIFRKKRYVTLEWTLQPFHRDSCDILTKNNILLVPNLYRGGGGGGGG